MTIALAVLNVPSECTEKAEQGCFFQVKMGVI